MPMPAYEACFLIYFWPGEPNDAMSKSEDAQLIGANMKLKELFASAAVISMIGASAALAGSPAPVVEEDEPYAVVPVAAPSSGAALAVAGGLAAIALIAAASDGDDSSDTSGTD
ncbi:hypothetical protein LCM08_15900 [Salipiger pacificus]|nr:hypothetical protein [Alloyangia mangrovi]MCA0941546.1 hypothetical protein [Alloyangia pacifica]MCA0946404.1 hypothetical protein [Alloyangia pacifica]